ncbi:class I SAM-dependent methyltransferase [Alteraurantiacibacter aquimixticola]|uniref:Class I SAM-dependent methyltransferase n=1 Tax=Alteraurantiacibacter aquimixticola TaxID=2489173 RepID=A0A4T3F240_9SPHN|nr:class I SAM-dependent methyltransferase [Alteraurantiacibacter aquimixticola]TIX51236.1 class I SAM-dependent methyltransferase [Alteraurantiacibacter aquimixticola]
MSSGTAARIENEKSFHDARFTEEVRDAQGKYYASIKHGSSHYGNRVAELAKGKDILEYGCGGISQGDTLASLARTLTGIDISTVAVEKANAAAANRGLSNVHYLEMNAEEMTFPDGSFDLVFGRGIIHHLDLKKSFESIRRVLRPGGTALFWEPLGHNPVLNRYRQMTPEARTPDEHPLLKSDFTLAERYFDVERLDFYGLTTLLSVPLRDTGPGDAVLSVTSAIDRVLFRSPMRWLAWYVLIELKKPAEEEG